jgi:hypothetical protein
MSSSLTRKRQRTCPETRARQNQQILRVGAFTSILVTVIVAVVYLLTPVLSPKESGITQTTNAKAINIQAGMDGFDMEEIRVKVSETVKVNLRSLDNEHRTYGGGKHQFAVDELGVNVVAQPLSIAGGTFDGVDHSSRFG